MPMTREDFQKQLKLRGNYHYRIDGGLGAMSKASFGQAVTEGSDRALSDNVIQMIAKGLAMPPSRIYAVRSVEAAGAGFDRINGRDIILHEGHRFSKLTGGRFDNTNPRVSYPTWDRTKYPASQDGRWEQVWEAITLDVDAGLMASSHGLFQIMGENYAMCGFKTPFDFVMAMSLSEDAQAEAFVSFITTKYIHGGGLVDWLREGRFDFFAEGYNGSSYAANHYDTKLATADRAAAKYNV